MGEDATSRQPNWYSVNFFYWNLAGKILLAGSASCCRVCSLFTHHVRLRFTSYREAFRPGEIWVESALGET